MNISIIRNVLACMFLCFSSLAYSAVILHDESVDGDMTNDFSTAHDYGLLAAGSYDVIGEIVDGPLLVDYFDHIRFSTAADWTVDIIALVLEGGTPSLFTVQRDSVGAVGLTAFNSAASNDILGTFSAGSYGLQFLPTGNSGTVRYTARINVAASVSEPSIIAIFTLGIIGLASRRLNRLC